MYVRVVVYFASLMLYIYWTNAIIDLKRSRNRIFIPSVFKFEVKGKSLAWLPIEIANEVRRRRFIVGPQFNDSSDSVEPEVIYDAVEDANDNEEYDINSTEKNAFENETEECTLHPITNTDSNCSTRMRAIETPPYPRKPLNLIFPTCKPENCILIEPPKFPTTKRSKIRKKSPRKKIAPINKMDAMTTSGAGVSKIIPRTVKEVISVQKKEITTMSTNEALDVERSTILLNATSLKILQTSTCPQRFYQTTIRKVPELATQGLAMQDTKVVLRIPPSLAELPIEILKDPKSEMLSLSLISGSNGDQQLQSKPIYIVEPRVYPVGEAPQVPNQRFYTYPYSYDLGKIPQITRFEGGYPVPIMPFINPPPAPKNALRKQTPPVGNFMNHFFRWIRSIQENDQIQANVTS